MNNSQKITAYTDGGSRGNPGPSAIGVVLKNENGEKIKEYAEYLGKDITNNEAEYRAVIFALKKIKHLLGKKKSKEKQVEVNSDSELLVNQLNGKYKVLHSKISELFLSVWNLKIDFGSVSFNLIFREKNKDADKLVNQALDSEAKKQKLV